jgi:hypothetical protein
VAGVGVQILDSIDITGTGSSEGSGGGDGGAISIDASFGDVSVTGDIAAESGVPDGGGGEIDVAARGSITVSAAASLSVRGNGAQSSGGDLFLDGDLGVTSAGTLNASAGDLGGAIDVSSASGGVSVSGLVDASARSGGGSGGEVTVEAGAAHTGTLVVGGTIDVGGGPCSLENGCGLGGSCDLFACDLTVTQNGRVLARAPDGGTVILTARELLTINGALNATATTVSGTDGSNDLRHPSRKSPVIGAGALVPAPVITAKATCTGGAADPVGCLKPCPVCGNGVVEFPETCDNNVGTPVNCDGCSSFCNLQTCNDGRVCTVDSCDPRLGCRFVPAATPCVEPATPTPSATSVPGGTATPGVATASPTRTATGSPTLTPIPSATQTAPASPTPTPSATGTSTAPPTDTATPTPNDTATQTPTATPTDTATGTPTPSDTHTPTASPTAAARGDANCDGAVTSTDVPALAVMLSDGESRCGADANGDGVLDEADVAATIDLMFNP